MGSPFKMNPKTPLMKALVGKQKNLPEQLKQAILDAPAQMTDKGKKKGTKKDDFRYESDMPEVIGTAYTKSGTERVTEYKKGGKDLKKGDTYDYGGFQTPKKVVDTGRDASGRKKAGRTGTVDVEVKKGDIRFSTGEKTKKKGASKSSPVKKERSSVRASQKSLKAASKARELRKEANDPKSGLNAESRAKNRKKAAKLSAKSKRVHNKGVVREGSSEMRKNYLASKGKSPAKMIGGKKGVGKAPNAKMQARIKSVGKKGRPGTGVRKEPKPLTPSQKANINAQNKKANANAKRTGRGTGLIKDPTMRIKKKK